MIEFHGRPFLEYLIEMLRDQGFERVLLLLGYLPEVVVEHFGDGSAFGVEIDYDVTEPDDLTGYRMRHARSKVDECFLFMYCDNYWPMRFDDMWGRFLASGAPAQVTVYTNPDGRSRDCVRVGSDGMVEVYDRSRTMAGLKGVEISYAILTKSVVYEVLPEHEEPFEQAVYPALAERRLLAAYPTEHRYYSVGDHARLPLTEAFLARRPAVILDRDGVLNVRPPRACYVRSPEEFHWLPGSLDALALLHSAGYRVIVVSNQAGINRGEMSAADLEAVHSHMLGEVRAAGGSIEAIYHCPHDWDEGCSCRKPQPGMLFRAQQDHHLDLTRTFFIGDDERDAQAARAAGCPSALVSESETLLSLTRRLLVGDLAEVPA